MALNPLNIIVSRTGTTSETTFKYTFVQMYLYTAQKTSKRLSDWQILKVPFDSGGYAFNLLFCPLAFHCSYFIGLTYYYIIISSSIDHLYIYIYKRLELSSLPLYSNFMLVKF